MLVSLIEEIIPDWDGREVAVELWLWATSPFMALGGTMVQEASPLTLGRNAINVRRVTCTIETGTNTLTIPAITNLYSTTDALDDPYARYSAWFFTPNGTKIKPYESFEDFSLPAIASQSWEDVRTYNNASTSALYRDTLVFNRTESDNRYLLSSALSNVVDRTTAQSIAGNKTFTGTTLLGTGDTINDGAFANQGATVNGLKLSDSLAASPYAGVNPLLVSDTTRSGDFIAIPWQYRLTKTAGLGDTYGQYSYVRYNVNMTGFGTTQSSYNQHGLRAVVELSPTNIGTSQVYGYGAWIHAIRNVSGVRVVGAQIESTNNSPTDAIGSLGSIDSTCALLLHSSGAKAQGPGLYFENSNPAAAFYAGIMPGPNSCSNYVWDNFQASFAVSGTWTSNGTTTLTGVGGNANREVVIGDMLLFNGAFFQVAATPSLVNTIVATAAVGAASGVITKHTVAMRFATNSPVQNVRANGADTDTILLYNSSDQLSLRGTGGILFQSPDALSTYMTVASGVAIGTYAGTVAGPAGGLIISGPVGIGTSVNSVGVKLDVRGNVQFMSDNASVAVQSMYGRTSEDFTFGIAGGAGDFVVGSLAGDTVFRPMHNLFISANSSAMKWDGTALTPPSDNFGSIGTAGLRWALVRATVITPGDLIFSDKTTGEELWKMHEDANFLYIQDYRSERDVAKFDREGNLYIKGEVRHWL